METNVKDINSCLMLCMSLETPVDLCYCFADKDLKYVEPESHITLLYAPNFEPKKEEIKDILKDIKDILPVDDYLALIGMLKEAKYLPEKWFGSVFVLDKFSNDDGDYLILRLNRGEDPYADFLYKICNLIHKSFKTKWEIETSFPDYTPHITLAKLEPGTADKYISQSSFNKILEDSYLSWSDIVLSIGETGEQVDRTQWQITSFNAVTRFFELKRAKETIEKCKQESEEIIEKEFSATVEVISSEIKSSQVNGEKPKTVTKFKRKKILED